MINGNALNLEALKNSRRVQKKAIHVQVVLAQEDGVSETKEGNVSYKAGDAIMTGVEGEQWPIERAKFDASYEAVPPTQHGEDGAYKKKPIPVYALQMDAPFYVTVSWSEDRLEGKPGDWLLQYGEGDYGVVSQSIFEKTYEFIDEGGKMT